MEFLVKPPEANASPDEWQRWMEAEKRAAASQKRSRTMSFEHGDFSEAFDGQFLAFDGDWEAGEGELVVGVEADQESQIERLSQYRENIKDTRKRTNAARRRKKRAQRREAKRARILARQ